MSTRVRRYEPETDFMRVRDFLKRTGKAYGRPLDWKIDRWNYARYFVAPYLGGDGRDDEAGREGSLNAVRFWESVIRIWGPGFSCGVLFTADDYSASEGMRPGLALAECCLPCEASGADLVSSARSRSAAT